MADNKPRSMEELKNDHDFDRFLAETLAERITQPVEIDIEKAIKQIKKEINPGMHNILP